MGNISQTLKEMAAQQLYLHRRKKWYAQPGRADPAALNLCEPPAEDTPDSFALIRVLGNDLYPRHRIGQNRENLQFILEHEPELAHCKKSWVVNRIYDAAEEQAILDLLEKHGASYLHLPFDKEAYQEIGWNALDSKPGIFGDRDLYETARYALKNAYVMNNNGARNLAIQEGCKQAKWVMPWDGNCFVRSDAWEAILAGARAHAHCKYFVIPMWRPESREALLCTNTPRAGEEPQIMLRCDSSARFHEAFVYGRRPKVELFWHLGIPGPWDFWRDQPWDPPRRAYAEDAFEFATFASVARVPSGHQELEAPNRKSFKRRGKRRNEAIRRMIDYIDAGLG